MGKADSKDALKKLDLGLLKPLMDEIERRLKQHCGLLSDEACAALTAWIIATHVAPLLGTAPGLVVTTPLGDAARSRVLQVVSGLAARPIVTTPSEASATSLFRASSKEGTPPSIFLNDADPIFRDGARGSKADLRDLVDHCHTRGLFGVRLGDDNQLLHPFAVVGLFSSSRLPREVEDRAVVIRLNQADEGQDRGSFRRRDIAALAQYANVAATLVEQHRGEIQECLDGWVGNPLTVSKSGFTDHVAETWEPLFAIADLAGPEWLDKVLHAAKVLEGHRQAERLESAVPERMLRDIARVLVDLTGFIGTKDLTDLLHEFGTYDWWSNGLTPTALSRTLSRLGLKPRPDSKGKRRGFRVAEIRKLIAKNLDGSDTSDSSDTSKMAS